MKVALIHDWLFHMRGGEKVLEALAEMFPEATIYTLFYDRKGLSPSLQGMNIKASFLQNIPGIRRFYRWLLPILPWAIRSIKIEEADIVISSSHCVAKGAQIPANATHFCYCHTPMRYLWGFENEYFQNFPFFLKPFMYFVFSYLKKWDLANNSRVDYFIANSENVKKRIATFYKREATVIYPPLDAQFFHAPVKEKNPAKDIPYYLVVSAFVPYKRVDLVIEAFNGLDRYLFIVGGGPLDDTYRKQRRSEKISFLGQLPSPELKAIYRGARALIFPTEEDFGIVPLEAQCSGTPVIAFGKGGALESVKSGIFFEEQTPSAIRTAILEFEALSFEREKIPAKVASFDKTCFKEHVQNFIQESLMKKENHVAR